MSAGPVRFAAIQATPVILAAEASVSKALHLLGEASGQGVKLAGFPDTFIQHNDLVVLRVCSGNIAS